jgi:hypothetical protein
MANINNKSDTASEMADVDSNIISEIVDVDEDTSLK